MKKGRARFWLFMGQSGNRNKLTMLVMSAIIGIGAGFCSENYLQAFVLRSGYTSFEVGLYGFALQLFALLAYLFSSRLTPYTGRLHGRLIATVGLHALLPLSLVASSLFAGVPSVFLVFLTLGGAAYGALTAYRQVVEVSLVPRLYNPRDFGVVTGYAGLVGGVATTLAVALGGRLVQWQGFPGGYYWVFFIATATFLLAALSARGYRLAPLKQPNAAPKPPPYAAILRQFSTARHFRLLTPHIVRGIGSAGIYYFMTVSMMNIKLSDADISLSIILLTVSSMVANLIFTWLTRRVASGAITLVANLVCGVAITLAALNKSLTFFMVLTVVYQLANVVSQQSTAVGVILNTPPAERSQFNAIRLLAFSCAMSLATVGYGYLFQILPAVVVMGFSGVLFAGCGVAFFRHHTDRQDFSEDEPVLPG